MTIVHKKFRPLVHNMLMFPIVLTLNNFFSRHRQHLLGPVIVENSKEEQEAHSPETRDNFTEKPNYEDINFKGAIFKLYDEQR